MEKVLSPQQDENRRQSSPNYSPPQKHTCDFTSSRENIQSPKNFRQKLHASQKKGLSQQINVNNLKLNQSGLQYDRIDKLEETLNRVCYNIDTILPLLDFIGMGQYKNGHSGMINTSSSLGNLHQKNESLSAICKKLSDHEDKLLSQEKIINNLKNQIEKQDHLMSHNINSYQVKSQNQVEKENLNMEIEKVIKQLKIEDKIAVLEQHIHDEFEKIRENKAMCYQNTIDLQHNFEKQIKEIQSKQDLDIKSESQLSPKQNNRQNHSYAQSINLKNISGINDIDTLNNITEQINIMNEQINGLKEFRQFSWKEMDNLWRNIGHLFCEIEMKNKIELQQRIEQSTQDIPQNIPSNEKELKLSIIEYFNHISNLDKFNHQNTNRIMNHLIDYNSQIDKLLNQQQNSFLKESTKRLEIHQQEIDTLEDRFINIKFQIEGTKQKMIFDMKKIEDKQELVEQFKKGISNSDSQNKESIKQDITIADHLKQKVYNLMDDVSKNIKQLCDGSENILDRLMNELKRGASILERGRSIRQTSTGPSRKGSDDNFKAVRKYTFGANDEIVYQPYTENSYLIQLHAIQTDISDEIKEY